LPVDADILKTRISDIRSSIRELQRLTSKPFVQLGIDERYSLRYNIIVLVEALVSLCTHIAIEEYMKTPSTYREAVQIVAEKIGLDCISELESLVGLRHLLVHRYWIIEDEKVYSAVKEDFKCVEEFLSRVEDVFLH